MQSGWVPEFLASVKELDLPIDFVATHEYPTDPNCGTYSCMGAVTAVTRANVTELVGTSLVTSVFARSTNSLRCRHATLLQ